MAARSFRRYARRVFGAGFVVFAGVAAGLRAQDGAALRPHASPTTAPFSHSSGAYSLAYPSDWQAHENGGRLNVGAPDGLVPTGRGGFRTVYGAIVAIVDDPEAGKPGRTIETSTRAIVDGILKRNEHQSIAVPVKLDRPFAGGPAASAVLIGTSPVTGRGERAEVVCRAYGATQILYVILVSPTESYADLERPLQQLRDSVRVHEDKPRG